MTKSKKIQKYKLKNNQKSRKFKKIKGGAQLTEKSTNLHVLIYAIDTHDNEIILLLPKIFIVIENKTEVHYESNKINITEIKILPEKKMKISGIKLENKAPFDVIVKSILHDKTYFDSGTELYDDKRCIFMGGIYRNIAVIEAQREAEAQRIKAERIEAEREAEAQRIKAERIEAEREAEAQRIEAERETERREAEREARREAEREARRKAQREATQKLINYEASPQGKANKLEYQRSLLQASAQKEFVKTQAAQKEAAQKEAERDAEITKGMSPEKKEEYEKTKRMSYNEKVAYFTERYGHGTGGQGGQVDH